MLDSLPHKTDNVFGTATYHGHRTTFEQLRDRTAKKLGNPRINKITFHTFRHWKGTIEYHKTHDIIHVKNVLGHKSIESTMIYINIEQAVFLTEQNDQFTCKVAHNETEAIQLIETGFDYITDIDGHKLFRKRK
jgi:integrase